MERVTILLLGVVLCCIVSLVLAEVEMLNYFLTDKITVRHGNIFPLLFLTPIIYDFNMKYAAV